MNDIRIFSGTEKKRNPPPSFEIEEHHQKSNVLVLGGASGCVSNIVVDYLSKAKCKFITAGRTEYDPRPNTTIPFLKYDIFEENSTEKLIAFAKKHNINCIINCICTGGKLSYDTTKIGFMNLAYIDTIVHIAKSLTARLIHFSSLKVGDISVDPYRLEKESYWTGPRSPYCWSKYAAELRLLSANYFPLTVIRIGLVDSVHGKKFYTRNVMLGDNMVNVTMESELYDMLNESMKNTDNKSIKYVNSVPVQMKDSEFGSSFSNSMYISLSHKLLDLFANKMLPTKILDYVSPQSSSVYLGP